MCRRSRRSRLSACRQFLLGLYCNIEFRYEALSVSGHEDYIDVTLVFGECVVCRRGCDDQSAAFYRNAPSVSLAME